MSDQPSENPTVDQEEQPQEIQPQEIQPEEVQPEEVQPEEIQPEEIQLEEQRQDQSLTTNIIDAVIEEIQEETNIIETLLYVQSVDTSINILPATSGPAPLFNITGRRNRLPTMRMFM